jgi:DNA-binding response OmpR family regulator
MTKVLYVDDEDDIREVAELALSLDPMFEVKTCPSGQDALSVIPTWKPDVIVLDVMMPGLDGPTTFALLKNQHGDDLPPVLFCTARTQADDVRSYHDLGGAGVIAKPFNPMELAAQVKSLIGQ